MYLALPRSCTTTRNCQDLWNCRRTKGTRFSSAIKREKDTTRNWGEWLACQSQLIKTQFPQIENVYRVYRVLLILRAGEQDIPHLRSPWIGRADKQNEQLREELWQDLASSDVVTFSHITRRPASPALHWTLTHSQNGRRRKDPAQGWVLWPRKFACGQEDATSEGRRGPFLAIN